MGDIRTGYSDDVRFKLKAINVDTLILSNEPIGWKDDDLELDRHKKYHGIFTNFTNNLEFINEAKDYINSAYRIGGINTNLTLIKELLVDDGVDVVWRNRYTAKADFNTMVNTQTRLTIKFNSNDLAELIKSHESDEFEIESNDPNNPLTSIDGKPLDLLVLDKVEIKGRSLTTRGESQWSGSVFTIFTNSEFNVLTSNGIPYTIFTDLISQGPDRHSAVFSTGAQVENITADSLFFDDVDTDQEPTRTIKIDYGIQFQASQHSEDLITVNILRVKFDFDDAEYSTIEDVELGNFTSTSSHLTPFEVNGTVEFVLQWDEGLIITYNGVRQAIHRKQQLILNEVVHFESSPNLDFIFNHDLKNRLMSIITGRNDAYYSKYFGREELGYVEDGQGGLIGVMSGFWARAFNRESEKYKSLKISLKDALESSMAVFNTGIGIEIVNFQERLREEDLKYFYQIEVAVRLPNQIKDVKRSVDKSLFFSGMTFGYDKSGDYEESQGLDEPNTKTEYVTPIRKSTNKFKKTSKIRADEYGMELARRKPQISNPDEDTRYDDNNWFLDLKRTDFEGYEQKDYTNRLQELPSGIHSPETFRSMFFTPLRMLMRHAWVFKAGMELYLDNIIKYISKDKNSTLTTHANSDWSLALDNPYTENEDILVRDLERPRFLPEIVEFEHPVDDDLMEWINGTTELTINGSKENVPNVYFKFEYKNENGNLERGYLLNLKPNKEGKWKMQLSNENIIT